MTSQQNQLPQVSALALPVLSLAYFVLGVGSLSIIGLIDPIAQSLDVTRGTVALAVTAFALTYACAAPVLQMLFGNLERGQLIMFGLLAIAAGAAGSAIAPNFETLMASRIMMALGGALVGPMSSAAGASLVAPENQGRALGIVFTGMTIATVLGVPLSAWLGGFLGWRMVMVVVALLALVIAALTYTVVPTGSRGMKVTPSAFAAIVLDRTITPAISVTFYQMTAQFVTYALIGAYLMSEHKLSADLVPVALIIFGIGGLIGNTIATRLLGRVTPERLITTSLVALTTIFTLLSVVPMSSLAALALLGMWAVSGTLMMSPQQARLVSLAPLSRNLVLALNASALYLGMAAGSALASLLYRNIGASALTLASIVFATTALLAFHVSRRKA